MRDWQSSSSPLGLLGRFVHVRTFVFPGVPSRVIAGANEPFRKVLTFSCHVLSCRQVPPKH